MYCMSYNPFMFIDLNKAAALLNEFKNLKILKFN